MKILDRYIIKKLVATFFVTIFLILFIGIAIDASEKIDDFAHEDLTFFKIVKDYYISFLIYYGNLFIPLFIFVASIWVTSKLSGDTEIIAILSAGVNFKRLAYPYFITSIIITLLSLFLSHFLVPEANQKRIEFEDKYIKGERNKKTVYDVYRQVKPNEYIYIREWNPVSKEAKKGFNYTKYNNENRMIYRFFCNRAKWNKDSSRFKIREYNEKFINEDFTENIISGYEKDTAFGFIVDDLVTSDKIATIKGTTELVKFIDDEKMRGAENVKNHLVEFHKRTSVPMSTFILILISLILSYKKKRGGIGINIAFGIALLFIYIFFMRITDMLAIKGDTDPLLAVWIPNIIFAILSIFLYRKIVD